MNITLANWRLYPSFDWFAHKVQFWMFGNYIGTFEQLKSANAFTLALWLWSSCFFFFFFFNIGYCENWNKLRVKIFLYCAYMFAYIYIRENCMHTQTVLYKHTSMYIYQYVNTCMFIHMQLCVCAIYIMFIYTVSWRLHLLFRRLNCKIEFFRNLIL